MAAVELNGVITSSALALSQLTISGYAGDERSADSGEPEELFYFNLADREYWYYTSSDYDITHDGNSYSDVYIKRSDIKLESNSLKTGIRIDVDISNPFALSFMADILEGVIELIIYRRHKNSADYKVYWKGYVHGIRVRANKVIISAGLKNTGLRRYGLMRKYQRNCGLTLYSTRCTMSEDNTDFQISGTILTVDGATITAAEFADEADDWLLNGKFQTDNNSCLQRIVYHKGTTIKISRPIAALAVGNTFIANAGCDGLKATCKTKFNNKLNFGGHPNIPNKNPFVGDSIVNK